MGENIKAGISIFIYILMIIMILYSYIVASLNHSSNGMLSALLLMGVLLITLRPKERRGL